MSIEIEIFPTRILSLTIEEVESCLRDLSKARPSVAIPVGGVLITTKNDLTTDIQTGNVYYVVHGCRSLSLSLWETEGNDEEYFRDHVRNVSLETLRTIASQNENVGLYFNLDSKMGRGEKETTMLLLLAATLAKLTEGLVILPDHPVENVPIGGYRWNEIIEKMESYAGNPIEPTTGGGLNFDTEIGPK